MDKDKLTAVRMSSKTAEALEKIAKEEDRSVAWVIRTACDRYIEQYPTIRRAMKQAMKAVAGSTE
jgi:predicted DNA-binding protein